MAIKYYSDGELNGLLGHFNIPKKKYAFRPLTDGYINDTFLVNEGQTPMYILQRVNHFVFPNVAGLMGNVQKALDHLKAHDYQKIVLVATRDGQFFYRKEKPVLGFWRLMTYIDGSTAYNTTRNPNIAKEAGRIIGKFHLLLQPAIRSDYVDTIPRFHDLSLRKEQFNRALAQASPDKLKIAENAIRFAKETLVKLESMQLEALPIRICHNDTKLNNILFTKESDKALCLIDLDTLMRGHFHFDFGDAVRTIANTAPEDEQDHQKITFERDLFNAFVEGIAANGPFLSGAEIKALPLGAVLMPFLHGIRALTDYLNNNIYYKVAYENQNLDRCLSLFDFTKKALDQVDYMERYLAQKLTPV
jgi:Ser/Thr protein kinase RdoA (MazF antagonist)